MASNWSFMVTVVNRPIATVDYPRGPYQTLTHALRIAEELCNDTCRVKVWRYERVSPADRYAGETDDKLRRVLVAVFDFGGINEKEGV